MLGMALGLNCHTHLAIFRLREPANGQYRCSWAFRVAFVNMSKMLCYRLDKSAKYPSRGREAPRLSDPVHRPMQAVIEEFTPETPPVSSVWSGMGATPAPSSRVPCTENLKAEGGSNEFLELMRGGRLS